MISVIVELSSDKSKQAKIFVTCPQCSFVDFFHNFIIRTCERCGFPWGNVLSLIQDIRVRRYYHQKGEIN